MPMHLHRGDLRHPPMPPLRSRLPANTRRTVRLARASWNHACSLCPGRCCSSRLSSPRFSCPARSPVPPPCSLRAGGHGRFARAELQKSSESPIYRQRPGRQQRAPSDGWHCLPWVGVLVTEGNTRNDQRPWLGCDNCVSFPLLCTYLIN